MWGTSLSDCPFYLLQRFELKREGRGNALDSLGISVLWRPCFSVSTGKWKLVWWRLWVLLKSSWHPTHGIYHLSSHNFAVKHIKVFLSVHIKQVGISEGKVVYDWVTGTHWIHVEVIWKLLPWFPFYEVQCAMYYVFFFPVRVSVFSTRAVKHWKHWAGDSTEIYYHVLSSVSLFYRSEGNALISLLRKSSQV